MRATLFSRSIARWPLCASVQWLLPPDSSAIFISTAVGPKSNCLELGHHLWWPMAMNCSGQGRQVIRTFLSTLCHEFCHLDFEKLGLADFIAHEDFTKGPERCTIMCVARRRRSCSGFPCRADAGALTGGGRIKVNNRSSLRSNSMANHPEPERPPGGREDEITHIASSDLHNSCRILC